MATITYYLIEGNEVQQKLELEVGARIALPLLGGKQERSVVNQKQFDALRINEGWTEAQVIEKFGLVDEREQEQVIPKAEEE